MHAGRMKEMDSVGASSNNEDEGLKLYLLVVWKLREGRKQGYVHVVWKLRGTAEGRKQEYVHVVWKLRGPIHGK